ncbi:M48 family metallopeptidase [Rhodohalobacter sp. 8-1]|uniref:M48 family metallopeptidase n=1 Tax=Rhodohalobacter sp. 8-1 TaxID=3131972 RepID=UPI0030ED6A25
MPKQQSYTIRVGNIPIEVTKKNVKHLRIVAYPSRKSVRISSPLHIEHEEIVEFAESKAGWIKKHFEKNGTEIKKLSDVFTNGSTHYLWGEPFKLRVVGGANYFSVARTADQTVELRVKQGSSLTVRERVMREWYRRELKSQIPALIKKWEPIMNVKVKEWNVKKMKTRWGTCNTRAGRIWISLNLAKKSPEFLEYIIVHEMTHLLERGHTRRFYRLMDKFHATWRDIDKRMGGRHWRKQA